MKKYWIIENERPAGPFTADELKVRRDFTASLPVWCSDFADWTTVENVPELACLVTEEAGEEQETVVMEEINVENEHERQSQQAAPEQQRTPWIITSIPDEINGTRRPKNYMAWNIVMLFCCCLPAAVVGLFYSSKVNVKWMQGDVEGALKASEYAQWCIILSFVLGLVAWPFQALFI